MSLLIWAAVAASAVYWGLHLFTRPTPVPVGAAVAALPPPAAGSLDRLLGTPPVPVAVEAAVLPADSRFRLVGVVAGRGVTANGLALISVDGKPARAVAVGRELEPGLRLLAVSHRQAELGASRGAPALTLALPPLAEANRGIPGDDATMGMPGQAGMPGQPGQPAMPGLPFGNRPTAGPPPAIMGGARLPGAPLQPMPLPPTQPQDNPPDQPTADGLPSQR
jgi:general secretion pathway protein C